MKTRNMLPNFSRTKVSFAAGAITALIGAAVLIGWQFDIHSLKGILPFWPSMKPNAALGFLLAGLSVILMNLKNKNRTTEVISKIFAAVVVLIGLLTLIEYLFHIDFGIDQILFKEVPGAVKTVIPGRIAFNLALGLFFTGISLLLVRVEKEPFYSIIKGSILLTAAIGTIAVLGYVFTLQVFLQLGGSNTIALNAAIGLMIISIGMYFTIPKSKQARTKIERNTAFGFLLITIFILTTSVISLHTQNTLTESNKWVQHSLKVIEKIERTLSLAIDIETGSRGYIITGDETFLEPFNDANVEIHKSIDELRVLTEDNITQQQNLDTLNALIEERISFGKGTISIRKEKGLQAALERIKTGVDKRLMDKIRTKAEKMSSTEYDLLNKRSEYELSVSEDAKLMQTIIIFIQIGFLIVIYFVISRDISGRREAEKELLQLTSELEDRVEERTIEVIHAEKKYRDMVETSLVGVYSTSLQGEILYINDAIVQMLEADSTEEYISTSILKVYKNPEDQNRFLNKLQEKGIVTDFEVDLIAKKGNVKTVVVSARLQNNILTGMMLDITERKKAEEEIKKANRVYAVLSNINQTIVRVKDTQTIYDEVCRIAVEDGKFRMAWIGMIDPQTNKVIPVASAGFTEDYLKTINIDLNDEKLNQGPTGRAVKSGVHYLANDIATNPDMIPWRENALRLGYKSSAAFPITVFGKTVGTFNLYTKEKFFFDKAEVKLLDELAMDISFAIEFNETEIERKKAEEELRLTGTIINNMEEGVYLIKTSDGTIAYTNPKFNEMFGYPPGELIGKHVSIVNAPTDKTPREITEEIIAALNKNKQWNGEVPNIRKDGTTFWCSANVSTFEHEKYGTVWISVHNDITERKRAEEEIRQAHQKYEELVNSIDGIVWEANARTFQFSFVSKQAEWLLGYPTER